MCWLQPLQLGPLLATYSCAKASVNTKVCSWSPFSRVRISRRLACQAASLWRRWLGPRFGSIVCTGRVSAPSSSAWPSSTRRRRMPKSRGSSISPRALLLYRARTERREASPLASPWRRTWRPWSLSRTQRRAPRARRRPRRGAVRGCSPRSSASSSRTRPRHLPTATEWRLPGAVLLEARDRQALVALARALASRTVSSHSD
mmetsp:Transcript_23230/g.78668  ORF Transcript_23230/g.78668 Transcript_23230/m.78668 type:complete len:203 (+) Transcript_23230:724-1332(+)